MVAIHVRVGDYGHLLRSLYNYKEIISDKCDYLSRAMNHLHQQGNNTLFFVVTQDKDLVLNFMNRMNLTQKYPVVWPSPNAKDVDFALIAMAEKVILSYGTYGLMAAFLYGKAQEVICPKGYEKFKPNLELQWANPPTLTLI